MKPAIQNALTVIAAIKPGRLHHEELRDVFDCIVRTDIQLEEDPPQALVPFKLLRTIHFVRWAILPGNPRESIPDSLLFSSNYDGTLDEHLEEFVRVAGQSGLDRIYEHCEDYPSSPSDRDRMDYLKAHTASDALTFYVGARGRTAEQVRKEGALREVIERFVDSSRSALEGKTATEIRQAIQAGVSDEATLKQFTEDEAQFETLRGWVTTEPGPWLTWGQRLLKKRAVVWLAALGLAVLICFFPKLGWLLLALAIAVVVLAVLAVATLRAQEKRDQQAEFVRDSADKDLLSMEDLVVQNQMTSITAIKPGWFRQLTLRTVLLAIRLGARFVYNEGWLGSIPTIHFARWVIIDNKKRLLFLSNFDGSWENYLGDFIDKAAGGLTAVWSNTQRRGRSGMDLSEPRGFPDSRLLTQQGARDEHRFKAYTRDSQVPTNVWYSARKKLSMENVNGNSKLRAGLFGNMSEREAADWLRLI